MKTAIVIGNWKMHKTAREAISFLQHFVPTIHGCRSRVFLAVSYPLISAIEPFATQNGIIVGAQNVHDALEGPYTGEVSSLMLREAGANFVMVGHSERRHLFNETNEWIHRKIVRAFEDDLLPVLCVGERLSERSQGLTTLVLKQQIESALSGISKERISKMILAYEPVWAIGTGISASFEQVSEVHDFCRECIVRLAGKRGEHVPILYGGSVNPENVRMLLSIKNVDGVLVGSLSLDVESFAAIIQNCEKRQ